MNPVGYLYNSPKGMQGERGIGYNYILASNGLFVEAENQHLKATLELQHAEHGKEVRGLCSIIEGITLKHGLVPRYLWERAWELLTVDPSSECYLAIVWRFGCYDLVQPTQKVTRASVEYQRPRNLVVDIHSHGAMKPFFSSTDDKDDQGFKISIVAGEMDKPLNTFLARVCLYGYFSPVRPHQVFECEGGGERCTP